MENRARQSRTKLMPVPLPEVLTQQVREYDFHQLVELILTLTKTLDKPLIEETYPIHFTANPSLGFAASDISQLLQTPSGPPQLEINFLGLSGAHSPLPGFYLEELLFKSQENLEGEDTWVVKELYDFFNHRLLVLLHQIWRKYRYYIYYHENARDRFSNMLFALVGLADKDLRLETPLNWCKMLSYIGLLASRSRSPQLISGIVAHYFELDDVSVQSNVVRKIAVPAEQYFCLGKDNSTLAEDVILGSHIQDCIGKFIISINELTLKQFLDFLPSGKEHQVLLTLVEFILREQLAFDVELNLKKEEIPIMQLSANQPAMLGWTSFMGHSAAKRRVLIQARR